jgi:serine/threonine protein kinase
MVPAYLDYTIVSESLWSPKRGGWGLVRLARNPKGEDVAMKFFGYTQQRPDDEAVAREIFFLRLLSGVRGAIQLVDVFEDSEDGIIENKNWRYLYPFPVIVMELIRGGELFDRIHQRNKRNLPVSEKYLARMFGSAMSSLKGIHDCRCIHRYGAVP